MSVTVYGASDDLIEIEGDIHEEFPAPTQADEEGVFLAFSDGTVLRIRYSQSGVWRIELVIEGDTPCEIEHAPEDDDDNYSDRATLGAIGPAIHYVVLGVQVVALKKRAVGAET